MATAETAKLVASLDLDTKKFDKGVAQSGRSLSRLGSSIAKSRAVAVGLGVGLERLAEKGISALGGAIGEGIDAAQELERVQQQTAAIIKSTGGAAGISAQQVRDLANAQEELTTVDDKNVQAGEDVLLRYTQIGKTVFPRATAAATNLAVALAKGNPELADVAGAARVVGKALADPVKGMTALRKAGIVLTAAEQKRIKALVKAGKTTQAQGVILAALEKRYGEAGKAASQGFGGAMRRFHDAVEDAQIALAQGLMPALADVATTLSAFLRSPDITKGLQDLGRTLGDAIKGVVAWVKSVDWGSVASGIKSVFGTIAGIVAGISAAWAALPEPLRTLLITGIVADRTMKFLFGFSPAKFVISGVESAVAGLVGKAVGTSLASAGIGKLFVQPVFVTNMGVGGIGGPAGAIPKGGGGLSLLGVGAATAIGLAIAAAWKSNVQDPQLQAQTDSIDASVKAQVEGNASLDDLKKSQAALKQGISDLTVQDKNGNPVPVLNDIFGVLYGGQKDDLQNQLKIVEAAIAAYETAHPPKPGPGLTDGGDEARRGAQADALAAAVSTGVQQGIGPDIEGLRGALGPLATGGDIEALRATTATGLAALRPTGGGDRGPGSQGDMESRRGAIGDALSGAIASAGLASSGDVEAVRGALDAGLAPVAQTADIAALQGKVADDLATTTAAVNSAGDQTSNASRLAGYTAANAAYGAGRGIENAIRSIPAPVTYVNVNVTGASVESTTTKSERNGPTSGSSSNDLRDYPH